MKTVKRKSLEARGWRIGNTEDFLGLSKEEKTLVEMRLSLTRALREKRKQKHLTQKKFAELIHSSQSRVAKMEAGDASVSLDMMIRSLIALGANRKELGQAIMSGKSGA